MASSETFSNIFDSSFDSAMFYCTEAGMISSQQKTIFLVLMTRKTYAVMMASVCVCGGVWVCVWCLACEHNISRWETVMNLILSIHVDVKYKNPIGLGRSKVIWGHQMSNCENLCKDSISKWESWQIPHLAWVCDILSRRTLLFGQRSSESPPSKHKTLS